MSKCGQPFQGFFFSFFLFNTKGIGSAASMFSVGLGQRFSFIFSSGSLKAKTFIRRLRAWGQDNKHHCPMCVCLYFEDD